MEASNGGRRRGHSDTLHRWVPFAALFLLLIVAALVVRRDGEADAKVLRDIEQQRIEHRRKSIESLRQQLNASLRFSAAETEAVEAAQVALESLRGNTSVVAQTLNETQMLLGEINVSLSLMLDSVRSLSSRAAACAASYARQMDKTAHHLTHLRQRRDAIAKE